jgi:hypothetical protein
MALLANVSLADTFDTWRVRTNQLIILADQNGTFANLGFNQANAAYVVANAAYGKANTAEANSLPLLGGTITGNLTITGNVVANGTNSIINLL